MITRTIVSRLERTDLGVYVSSCSPAHQKALPLYKVPSSAVHLLQGGGWMSAAK